MILFDCANPFSGRVAADFAAEFEVKIDPQNELSFFLLLHFLLRSHSCERKIVPIVDTRDVIYYFESTFEMLRLDL